MRQDLTSIKQQVAEIRTNQQRPFIGVGYGLENALVLINAFGERITLSMEFCWSQTVRTSILFVAADHKLI